jgi:RNA polymerase sigma factor (sigma-70 family)
VDVTSEAMTHAEDARDSQLLEDGDIAALLAIYEPVILGRCIARLKGSLDADDVAQDVRLRLLAEFRRGKRYGDTPYRVVVHKVIDWTLRDHWGGLPTHVPLPEGWEPPTEDTSGEVVSRYWMVSLFDGLSPGERAVFELRYLQALDHDQIAARLGIDRNNVDQRLFRGHGKLKELVAT